ncbi:MAG: hypothetical protein NTZ86_09660, partial [Legionellales bacterium]|nr:hypothetical protein [Legionellales bacterium]
NKRKDLFTFSITELISWRSEWPTAFIFNATFFIPSLICTGIELEQLTSWFKPAPSRTGFSYQSNRGNLILLTY